VPVQRGDWNLALLQVYQVGWGDYARFWKYISPVLIGVLAVLRCLGGLTGFGVLRGRRGLRVVMDGRDRGGSG